MVIKFVHYTKSKQADSQPILVGVSTLIAVEGHEDVFGSSIKDPLTFESARKGAKYLKSTDVKSLTFDGIETRIAS